MPNVDLYRRFEEAGVTDLICAPWMMVPEDVAPEDRLARRLDEMAAFAQEIIEPMRG